MWMSPNLLNHPEMGYGYVVEFKYLRHDASDGEVAAKLEEARGQLRQYAGEGKAAALCGRTKVRYIAVVYRAWELAALEEIVSWEADEFVFFATRLQGRPIIFVQKK